MGMMFDCKPNSAEFQPIQEPDRKKLRFEEMGFWLRKILFRGQKTQLYNLNPTAYNLQR